MRFPSGFGSLQLFMRHEVSVAGATRGPPVLFLHGATFPSANAAAWRMDGRSWMDELVAAGYDVYALDFLGYGGSDRYPEMALSDPNGPPPDNIEIMTRQVGRAVDEIIRASGGEQVTLIAHSAGTFVAGRYAELHPERVARLVLFGAPAPSGGSNAVTRPQERYFHMSAADELDAFEKRVRQAGRLDPSLFGKWTDAYLASDSTAGQRHPPSVRVPAGMRAAFAEMNGLGKLPYDPARIAMPVLVIVGEWDEVSPPAQGQWLFAHLAAPLKRFVVLSQGGHRLHLERSRFQLYRETEAFLIGGDEPGNDIYAVFFEARPAGEKGREAYLATAAKLTANLRELPGFISIERFEDETRPGWVLSLSRWRDEGALITWRENVDHRLAQEEGRRQIFEDYRVRVACQVEEGGDLTLVEGPARRGGHGFDSLSVAGHQVTLLEGGGGAGTHWQVIRDYGMHDNREPRR